ncbi:bacteriorhodopsin [Clostridium tarantellae]|uniref:Lactococcin n=1 Tax=Clostridium tarantellae TaxID=39493 RepID=A0A6I1MRX8_9CLOT|nr:bacteriorhodopsin [Clostridium tarantellae]MPQ44957.1 lactococcin [Clostridium tarantellae]
MYENIVLMHWIYVFVMFLGILYFTYLLINKRDIPNHEYLIAIIIPIWSALAYMSIALGQGTIEINGRILYFARYLDWIVTTPLLLTSLSLSAMFKSKVNKSIIASLIFADVIMIITGGIADISINKTVSYIWYWIGMVALVYIIYIIWNPLKKLAFSNSKNVGVTYTRLATYLTVFWILYPTFWILSKSGIGVLGAWGEAMAFIIIPIFSKVGFSIFDLYNLGKITN